jgi:hypothetical protein
VPPAAPPWFPPAPPLWFPPAPPVSLPPEPPELPPEPPFWLSLEPPFWDGELLCPELHAATNNARHMLVTDVRTPFMAQTSF